jgi:hypothetical protein
MVPQVWRGQSEPLKIRVLPLPEQGRPPSYLGGIGDFTVTSAVDKYEVHANEAVTLTVKVEGHGNLSTLQAPKAEWPQTVELFDAKGRSQAGKDGVSHKVFEFVLIPRVPGDLEIPKLDFGFFNPTQRQYEVKSTQPVAIRILDPLPGSSLVKIGARQKQLDPVVPIQSAGSLPNGQSQEVRSLRPWSEASATGGKPIWHQLYWACLASFGALVLWVLVDALRRSRSISSYFPWIKPVSRRRWSLRWEQMEGKARTLQREGPWQEVLLTYEALSDEVFHGLEAVYAMGLRSLSRAELEERLVQEKGLPPEVWARLVRLLEFSEQVRFASSSGPSFEASARSDLLKWVVEAKELAQIIHSD